jgi:hypothetical protein
MAAQGDGATAERADYHAAPHLQPPLVCCIPLFYSAALLRTLIANRFRLRQIVRLIHATTRAYATREGVARRARVSLQAGMAAAPPKR